MKMLKLLFMFENLTNKLETIFKKLRGYGKLNEDNIKEALREIRIALLEADVNLNVVKEFIEKIKIRAVGQEVMSSLTPGQQVVKIVNEELTTMLGGTNSGIALVSKPPIIIMMVGLQGSGKTTTSAKLARRFLKEGQLPLLVAADIYRPAAIEQLNILGKELGIPVFNGNGANNPIDICKRSLAEALEKGCRSIVIDTARRFLKEGQLPFLVAADIYRPAAIEQLNILGKELGIPVFNGNGANNPIDICKRSLAEALEKGC